MNYLHKALLSITSIAAFLAANSPVPTEAGSLDSLVEACDATDPDLVQLLENEALIVNPAALEQNPMDGSWTLAEATYDTTYMLPWVEGEPVCHQSRFYGQSQVDRTVGLPFRSAVQVGSDLILTAFHHDFNPATELPLKVVFRLRHRLVNQVCTPPDFNHIPDADVFDVTEVVADGWDQADPDDIVDFLLLRLDRTASTTYPRVRRSGGGRGESAPYYLGDRVTIIGHPERLAAKVDVDGRLFGYNPYQFPPWGLPLFKNLHPIDFNSGSMVYNRDEEFVETVVNGKIAADYEFVGADNCLTLVQVNEDGDPYDSTHLSVSMFADRVPAFELLVPLDPVSHDCSLTTGSCTNSPFHRTIGAPEGPGIAYAIQSSSGNQPRLVTTFVVPSQGTLSGGSSFDITESINLTGASPGTFVRSYTVRDLTHGFNDVVRHVITISP
jgi:hypothetical protein